MDVQDFKSEFVFVSKTRAWGHLGRRTPLRVLSAICALLEEQEVVGARGVAGHDASF